MGLTVKTNGLQAMHARVRNANETSLRASAMTLVDALIEGLVAVSPKDTNRFVNGWIEAGHGCGVTRFPKLPIKPSKVRNEIIALLVEQASIARKRLYDLEATLQAWYTRKGRREDKTSTRMRAQVEKQKDRIRRAEEALRRYVDDATALAIMRKTSMALAGNQRHLSAKALNLEVRDQVYGGTGRVVVTENKALVAIKNNEPHSTAVERRTGTLKRAEATARAFGLRRAGRTYFRNIASAAKGGKVA